MDPQELIARRVAQEIRPGTLVNLGIQHALPPAEVASYGWRIGRVVDPFGHHWEIGRPLSDQ